MSRWIGVTRANIERALANGVSLGNATFTGVVSAAAFAGTNINAAAAGQIYWSTRATMQSSADGVILLANFAVTGFTSLLLATGAGTAIGWYVGSGSPENVVTARVGSLYSRIDGGADTTLYVKESGTGNTGWAAI